jgi:excisionase family DNA binding protein
MNKEFTTKQAAEIVGVTDSRIRQMVLAGEIDHRYFGRVLVITEKGINQAKNRIDGRSGRHFKSEIKKAA